MAAYDIFRHPYVEQDLIDIALLIANYAGENVAERKLTEIEITIKNLSHTPHIGTLRHEIYPDLRAIPTARKGVICFTVDEDTKSVYIVAIAYAGREWIHQLYNRNL